MLKKLLLRQNSRKVPEVLLLFWLIKLLTTALGESTSDYLVHNISPVLAVIIGAVGFTLAIALQFYVQKYIAWVYWLAITMIAIFGTMAADVVHIVLGVPYFLSTLTFALALLITFFTWYKSEHTLSIHSIHTFRRELFYWLTVGFTFALGTAAGDMSAITFHLGYFGSALLFGILFLLPLLSYQLFRVGEVFTFWFAYIMTRPLGASFADWFGKTKDLGGLGVGSARVSVILAALIIIFVVYLSVSKIDVKEVIANKA